MRRYGFSSLARKRHCPLPCTAMEDDTNPATKADFQEFREEFRSFTQELNKTMKAHKEEFTRDFRMVVENAMEEILGANADDVEVLKDTSEKLTRRLGRLEAKVGLTAA